ncbi:speriolin-like protein [Odontesthes bonariensis]
MNLGQSSVARKAKSQQLAQENDQLKSVLNLLQENMDLRARVQSFSNDTLEELTVSGAGPSSQRQHTFNEQQFRKDLQQTKTEHEHRTSSPIDFKSFLQSSAHKDTDETAVPQSQQFLTSEKAACTLFIYFNSSFAVLQRLFGEIAYQLDRRILSYVFQAHERLYGFTLFNIPEKIIEVSTHPLTGKVDEGYQLHLTQRYVDLMDRLRQLGYKPALHPPFSEFIVNTYGILKERPSKSSAQESDYNSPDFLRKLIITTAPTKLQKDLLLVLSCLCNMAAKDRKPLLLW